MIAINANMSSRKSSPKQNIRKDINEDLVNFTWGSNLNRLPYYMTKNATKNKSVEGKLIFNYFKI